MTTQDAPDGLEWVKDNWKVCVGCVGVLIGLAVIGAMLPDSGDGGGDRDAGPETLTIVGTVENRMNSQDAYAYPEAYNWDKALMGEKGERQHYQCPREAYGDRVDEELRGWPKEWFIGAGSSETDTCDIYYPPDENLTLYFGWNEHSDRNRPAEPFVDDTFTHLELESSQRISVQYVIHPNGSVSASRVS